MKAQDFINQGYTEEQAKGIVELYQQEASSWNKLHSKVINELGLFTAAVFGVIESYSKMDHCVCFATHSMIAERLGISRRTVLRAIKELIEAGYIEDTTPGLRNRPHRLKVLWKS